MDNQPTNPSQDPPAGSSSEPNEADPSETEPGFGPDGLTPGAVEVDPLGHAEGGVDRAIEEAFDNDFDLDPASPDTVEMKTAADAEAAGLQHWTAPPTGQVPAVLLDGDERGRGQVSGPSWQNNDPGWSGPDLADVLADPEGASAPAFDPNDEEDDEEIEEYRQAGSSSDVTSGDDGVPSIDDIRFADPSERAASPVLGALADGEPVSSPAEEVIRPDQDRSGDASEERLAATGAATAPARPASSSPGDSNSDPTVALDVPGLDGGDGSSSSADDEAAAREFFGEETPRARELLPRIVVGLGLAAVSVGVFTTNPLLGTLLVMALATLAVLEFYNAMRVAGLRPATLLGMVATLVCPLVAYSRGDVVFPLIMVLSVVFGCLWYLVGADTERPVLNLSLTLLGVYWIGGMSAFAGLMLAAEGGSGLLLATIFLVSISDIMAYVGGRVYGRTPFHSVSPNKTWEGTMTGFLGAVFAGLLIGVFDLVSVFDGRLLPPILLAAVVGILGPIGDLAESLVKRDLGVKDMGSLLPGHGGVFDRVDSLLFALPGAYYTTALLGLL